MFANAQAFRAGENIDTLPRQDIGDRCRYVCILVRSQTLPVMDDTDLAAKPPIHLTEFQTNIAAAQYQQVARQEVDVHHRSVGEVIDLIEARNLGHIRASTDIDENPVGRKDLAANLYLTWRYEPRMGL